MQLHTPNTQLKPSKPVQILVQAPWPLILALFLVGWFWLGCFFFFVCVFACVCFVPVGVFLVCGGFCFSWVLF